MGHCRTILLGFLLLMQAGPMCACAMEHALFCGDAEVASDISQACCDDPGCTIPANCPRHSDHGSSCSVRAHTSAPTNQTTKFDVGVAANWELPVHFCMSTSPDNRAPDADPPHLPVDIALSLPLLN